MGANFIDSDVAKNAQSLEAVLDVFTHHGNIPVREVTADAVHNGNGSGYVLIGVECGVFVFHN